MNIFRAIVVTALAFLGASAWSQSCSNSTSLGNMGPPDLALVGNSFNSAGSYSDCYTFDLSTPAGSFGGAIELNSLFNKLEIDVTSVSLYSGGSLLGFDDSPLFFSFGALAGGVSYTLAIASSVTQSFGLTANPVGYVGAFATYAAPVPEPSTYAMLLIGLLGVGVAARRKMR